MRCVAFCCLGIEDILAQEIKELCSADSETFTGGCLFETDQPGLSQFAFMTQSAERVGELIGSGEIGDDPDSMPAPDAKIESVFSLGCKIIGKKNFKSNDIVMLLSEKIKEKNKVPFTYKKADVPLYVYVVDTAYYIFRSASHIELSKRDYKVFVNKSSFRGTIAYALGRIADVKEGEVILDPFCKSGEIPLELAHFFIGKSVHHYAKEKFVVRSVVDEVSEKELHIHAVDGSMPNVKAAEKNAKIAGVHKIVQFSRTPSEDLDLKFSNDVDIIVTQLPALGKESERRILDTYRSFFRVCKHVLSKKGTITCAGINILPAVEIASAEGFVKKHERTIMQGKEELQVYQFTQA